MRGLFTATSHWNVIAPHDKSKFLANSVLPTAVETPRRCKSYPAGQAQQSGAIVDCSIGWSALQFTGGPPSSPVAALVARSSASKDDSH
jgi:hypothetical protein